MMRIPNKDNTSMKNDKIIEDTEAIPQWIQILRDYFKKVNRQ